MHLFSVDTATPACSAALIRADGQIFERSESVGSRHAELLPVMASAVFAEAGILPEHVHTVVFNAGPGSYTGLRIGLSFLKGLFFGNPVDAIALGTLAGYAWAFHRQQQQVETIHAVIDARRQHVYHQTFHVTNGRLLAAGSPEIRELTRVAAMAGPDDRITGTGLSRFDATVSNRLTEVSFSARLMAGAARHFTDTPEGRRVDLRTFEPDYLGAPV